MTTLLPSYIWTAYSDTAIGSKISTKKFQKHFAIELFETMLTKLIEEHDHSKDRARGQHFIMLPNHLSRTEVNALFGNDRDLLLDMDLGDLISCGVGLNTTNVDDYIHRLYRGRVQSFLTRKHALPLDWCAVIVYDREAYLADPQMPAEERERVLNSEATHFLVALLANAKDVPNASGTYRFVSNLCGGNNAFKDLTLEEIRDMAQKSLEYQDKWCVVADPEESALFETYFKSKVQLVKSINPSFLKEN